MHRCNALMMLWWCFDVLPKTRLRTGKNETRPVARKTVKPSWLCDCEIQHSRTSSYRLFPNIISKYMKSQRTSKLSLWIFIMCPFLLFLSQFGNQESLSPNSPWGSIWIDELLILSALSDTKAELDYTQLTMPVWRRDDDVGLVSGCPYRARQGCGRAREGHGWAGEGTNEYQWWVKTDIHVGAIPSSSLQIPGESHGWILY